MELLESVKVPDQVLEGMGRTIKEDVKHCLVAECPPAVVCSPDISVLQLRAATKPSGRVKFGKSAVGSISSCRT